MNHCPLKPDYKSLTWSIFKISVRTPTNLPCEINQSDSNTALEPNPRALRSPYHQRYHHHRPQITLPQLHQKTRPAKMCKYCKHSIFTPTDISDLLKAYRTALQIYPTRTLAQQLAAIAREFQQIWEPSGEMGLPENWDWRKLGQVLKEHGVEIELPFFKGLEGELRG